MNRFDLRGWLWNTEVSMPARFVYLVLAVHANGSGRAWPSTTTIQVETRLGKSTVRAALRELESGGDIKSEFRNGLSTVYQVSCPPANSWRPTPPTPGALPRQETNAPPPDQGPTPASSWRHKVLKDKSKGGSAAAPRNGAAARPTSPSPVFTTDEGATFLPGTGWIS